MNSVIFQFLTCGGLKVQGKQISRHPENYLVLYPQMLSHRYEHTTSRANMYSTYFGKCYMPVTLYRESHVILTLTYEVGTIMEEKNCFKEIKELT